MTHRDAQAKRDYAAMRRQRAREYVEQVRAQTVCARCGAQPIDWHSERHVEHPGWRISALIARPAGIPRIEAEIAQCEALCRSCHMREDGRIGRLQEAHGHWRAQFVPRPCANCGRPYTPLRRGLCNACRQRKPRPAS